MINRRIAKIAEDHGRKVHVLAYSFAGVDTRCAISLMGLDKSVQSLTTLCTPHHGLTLMDTALTKPDYYGTLAHTEKALQSLGMSVRNTMEFTSRNMQAFNEVCIDAEDVKYASFGAKRKELQLNELLRANYVKITDLRMEVDCDGLVRTPDSKWGTYLLTFEHDHLEVAGLNPLVDIKHVVNLMTDNCRVCEIEE